MAYEGEHPIELRVPTWMRWTGSLLSVIGGIVVGALSTAGIGIFVGICLYFTQIMFSGGVPRSNGRKLRVDRSLLQMGDFKLIEPKDRLGVPEIRKTEEATTLRLRTRFRIYDIGVRSGDEANEIIDALGAKDTRQATAYLWRAPLPNWTELGFLLAVPALIVLLASIYWSAAVVPLVAISAIATIFATTARLYSAEVEVHVGRDGITLRQGLRPPRFIRHQQIRSVQSDKAEIVIHATGEPIRLSSTLDAEADDDDMHYATAIAKRVEQSRAAAAELPAAPPETPGLLRGQRSIRDWLDGLRKLGEGGESAFRDSAPPRDQLWQIIESIDAPAVERIAAAVALKTSGLSTEEAPRLRIAADAAVEPKLGERLRVVSDTEPEALVGVLEEAHKEEA